MLIVCPVRQRFLNLPRISLSFQTGLQQNPQSGWSTRYSTSQLPIFVS